MWPVGHEIYLKHLLLLWERLRRSRCGGDLLRPAGQRVLCVGSLWTLSCVDALSCVDTLSRCHSPETCIFRVDWLGMSCLLLYAQRAGDAQGRSLTPLRTFSDALPPPSAASNMLSNVWFLKIEAKQPKS